MTDPFIDLARRYLTGHYPPRIRACLDVLSPGDVWWRPNERSNSVGNLVLHLCGNARQWVVSGLGGDPDVRKRHLEFERRDPMPTAELQSLLSETVAEVDRTLAGLDPARLEEDLVVQGTEVTGREALLHAVEHFSMHTGQIIWITKMRAAADLGFYKVDGGVATPTWDPGSGHR